MMIRLRKARLPIRPRWKSLGYGRELAPTLLESVVAPVGQYLLLQLRGIGSLESNLAGYGLGRPVLGPRAVEEAGGAGLVSLLLGVQVGLQRRAGHTGLLVDPSNGVAAGK